MRTKPQSPGTPVRWSHPLAAGLVRAWVFNGRRGRDSAGWRFWEHVQGDYAQYARSDADTFWTNGPAGPTFQAGATGGAGWDQQRVLSRWGPGLTASSLTVLGRYQKFGANPNLETTPGDNGSALLGSRIADADTGFALYTVPTAVRFVADGSGLLLGAKYDTTISSGVSYTVGGSYHRNTATATYGGTWRVYLDGVLRGENNYSVAGSFGGTFTDTGPKPWSYRTNAADKRPDYLYAWSRALAPWEVAWATDQPFDLFAQRRAWGFGATAGGGGGAPAASRTHMTLLGVGA